MKSLTLILATAAAAALFGDGTPSPSPAVCTEFSCPLFPDTEAPCEDRLDVRDPDVLDENWDGMLPPTSVSHADPEGCTPRFPREDARPVKGSHVLAVKEGGCVPKPRCPEPRDPTDRCPGGDRDGGDGPFRGADALACTILHGEVVPCHDFDEPWRKPCWPEDDWCRPPRPWPCFPDPDWPERPYPIEGCHGPYGRV